MEYYSAIKNELLSPVTPWINLEGISLSEESDRERLTPHGLTRGIKNQKQRQNTSSPRTDWWLPEAGRWG